MANLVGKFLGVSRERKWSRWPMVGTLWISVLWKSISFALSLPFFLLSVSKAKGRRGNYPTGEKSHEVERASGSPSCPREESGYAESPFHTRKSCRHE